MMLISAGPQSGVLYLSTLYLLMLFNSELSLPTFSPTNAFVFFFLPIQAFHLLLNLTQKISSSLMYFISSFPFAQHPDFSYKMLFIVSCD